MIILKYTLVYLGFISIYLSIYLSSDVWLNPDIYPPFFHVYSIPWYVFFLSVYGNQIYFFWIKLGDLFELPYSRGFYAFHSLSKVLTVYILLISVVHLELLARLFVDNFFMAIFVPLSLFYFVILIFSYCIRFTCNIYFLKLNIYFFLIDKGLMFS